MFRKGKHLRERERDRQAAASIYLLVLKNCQSFRRSRSCIGRFWIGFVDLNEIFGIILDFFDYCHFAKKTVYKISKNV